MNSLVKALTKAFVENATSKSPTGVSFIHLSNYVSSKTGEVSNVQINVGASYEKAKQKDVETLKALDVATLKTSFGVGILEEAKQALIGSLIAPSKKRSKGQTDAYEQIGKGVKVHKESGKVFIYGYIVKKTVVVEGEHKAVNSSKLTLAKNFLKKECNLRTSKFRQYVVSPEQVDKLSGGTETIEFVFV